MVKKKKYIGAYRDENGKVRPITARKEGSSKTGIPVRPKANNVNPQTTKKDNDEVITINGVSKTRQRWLDDEITTGSVNVLNDGEMEIRANMNFIDDTIPSRPPPGPFTRQDLREIHALRGEKAVDMDDELYATPAETQDEWLRKPNRTDIRGIDEFPLAVQRDFAQNFPDYIDQLEEYYDTDVLPGTSYQIHRDRDSFNRASLRLNNMRLSSGVLGFSHDKPDGTGEIHMDDATCDVFRKGVIKSPRDFLHFEVVFHELGHRIGPSGYNLGPHREIGKNQEYFGTGFDEGANEILAQRFILNNVRIDPKLRSNLTATPAYDEQLYEHISTYEQQQRMVAKCALIASNGDEKKAIEWIEDLRYAPTRRIAEDSQRQFVDQVLRAQRNAEKRGSLKARTMPDNERDAENLLKWSRSRGSNSTRNQLDNVIKELKIKDPYYDAPPKYRIPKYRYEYELVKDPDTDRTIRKKVKGSKYQSSEEIIPWWMVV